MPRPRVAAIPKIFALTPTVTPFAGNRTMVLTVQRVYPLASDTVITIGRISDPEQTVIKYVLRLLLS